MRKIFLMVFAVAFLFSSCEKDDICDEPTTPRLIIEFYDALNPTVLKNVTDLKVTGIGMTESLTFNAVSTIELPLKTNLDNVKYELILNSTSTTMANTDFLEFNYTRENVFVSRACGFKTVFVLNDVDAVLLTDNAPTDNLWIQDFTIATSNIENENETHIKIYF